MGIPLSQSEPLLRITAAQMEVMTDRGAFAGLGQIELRDGVLCEMNAQHRPHLLAKLALYDALRDALRAMGSPLSIASEGSVLIGEREVPIPDVFIWSLQRGRGPVPAETVRLVAEVSETTLADDLGRKRLVYAAGGIAEYWVIDLEGQVVWQFWSPGPQGYRQEAEAPFGTIIGAKTLPGLTFDTAALLDPA